MNTRTITNIVLVVSGLAVAVSGFLIWARYGMPYAKFMHLNASLLMTAACLIHVYTWRAAIARCFSNTFCVVVAVCTVALLGLSLFVGAPGTGAGPGGGRHRAEAELSVLSAPAGTMPAPVEQTFVKQVS